MILDSRPGLVAKKSLHGAWPALLMTGTRVSKATQLSMTPDLLSYSTRHRFTSSSNISLRTQQSTLASGSKLAIPLLTAVSSNESAQSSKLSDQHCSVSRCSTSCSQKR
eukprot:scaffold100863_cov57-Phaeocystis_antarctica.AAC.2